LERNAGQKETFWKKILERRGGGINATHKAEQPPKRRDKPI
jgi:hypothetical protein